jgi:hypothetical protein
MRARASDVLWCVLAAALAACDSASSSTTGLPLPLDAELIAPAEVGPGIVVQHIQGGHSLTGHVTLDLCHFAYASESQRVARAQVNFVDPKIDRVAASQEIVRYAPGGAARAYAELKTATSKCPASYQLAGTPPPTISHVGVQPPDPRLVPAQVTVSMMVSFPDGTSAWGVSVYQFDGDVMTGIYTGRPQQAQALSEALVLAPVAAARLRTASGG